jgi:acyl-coenzyme A thioesterase PaaI-like protein
MTDRDHDPAPLNVPDHIADLLARHASHQRPGEAFPAGPLPPHIPTCLGCGPDNPHGHQLSVHADGPDVTAEHSFDERHGGAPGIAHGGALATVFDDLYGFLLYNIGELAVTRSLTVDYQIPARLHVPYRLRARLAHRDGRKLHLSASATAPDKTVIATSTALFLTVDIGHFVRAVVPDTGSR